MHLYGGALLCWDLRESSKGDFEWWIGWDCEKPNLEACFIAVAEFESIPSFFLSSSFVLASNPSETPHLGLHLGPKKALFLGSCTKEMLGKQKTGMSGSVPGGAGPVGSGGLRSQCYETLILAHDQEYIKAAADVVLACCEVKWGLCEFPLAGVSITVNPTVVSNVWRCGWYERKFTRHSYRTTHGKSTARWKARFVLLWGEMVQVRQTWFALSKTYFFHFGEPFLDAQC